MKKKNIKKTTIEINYAIKKKSSEIKKKVVKVILLKLSIFQPNKYKFKKSCPLSVKGAPEVDYKNIRLLKKIYV